MRTHNRGFTLVEASLSGAILVVLMLAAITASTSATISVKNTSDASELTAKLLRSEDRFKGWLSSASLGSLVGIPEGGSVPEPLQDDIPYDTLGFRRVVGVSAEGAVFEPPVGAPPYRLFFLNDIPNSNEGHLYMDLGDRQLQLPRAVQDVTFTKTGNRLVVDIDARKHGEEGVASRSTCSLVIRSE